MDASGYIEGGNMINNVDRRMGNPRTDEERWERHRALYPDEEITELPPHGSGLVRRGADIEGRRFGNPKTDTERAVTHYGRYGTMELPDRGRGLSTRGLQNGEFNWKYAAGCGVAGFLAGVLAYAMLKS